MKKTEKRLLVVTLILLFLAAVAFPIATTITYALHETETPLHVLNYETNRLYWENGTHGVDENGVYQLSLFDSLPTGEDGEKIISPGDEDKNEIQLRNKTGHDMYYKAVLYKISRDNVPINADFTNIPESDNERLYTLPDGVEKTDVVRAVGGKLAAYELKTFELEWVWEYYIDDTQDALDTMIGNLSSSDVTLGVWFTVSDNIEPDSNPTDINIDLDEDGKPDLNIDTDNDNQAEINIDIDGDNIPDVNIDNTGDNIPDLNVDLDGDAVGDFNFDSNDDGIADTSKITLKNEGGAVIVSPEDMQAIVDKFGDKKDLTLKLDNLGQHVNAIEVPKAGLDELIDEGDSLEFNMTNLKAAFDTQALESLISQSTGDSIRIVVKEILKEELGSTQQAALDNSESQLALAVKAYAYSGNTVIRSFEGGNVKIFIPFKAHKSTRIIDYAVYEIKADGKLMDMKAQYEEGFFTMNTDELSEYVVLYHGKTNITGIEPEPPECVCKICLFGGNCTHCWLCWSFVILLGLSIFVFIVITISQHIK